MVDTLVSGASASRRVGSTPIMRTKKKALQDPVGPYKNRYSYEIGIS